MMPTYPRLFSFILSFVLLACTTVRAQNRLHTHNTIVWLNTFHTINLNNHWAVLAEYQWRRTEGLKSWQQSLLRGGIQYKFNNGVSVLAGYGWIETFPYGDYPPAAPQPFPEHRIYEQVIWNDNIGRLQLNHRGRLEQRFLGVLDPQSDGGRVITRWNYLNRFRYQLRATLPLNHPGMTDKTVYAAAFDEIFIGFGKNVNANIFDQNRLGILLGYKLNKRLSLEAGYLNQTLQQPQPVGGKPVFQANNGFILNLLCNWN
ncbi:DUF2490 domain-containing protein [Taibaiella helva]|uniref:DUF2490 domain-containing protein n=1 Tax=Taibaiella helva TaxID=2301235 RepID=UPI000E56EE2D|nr:DUF2490 domain-containing protein [Taibaiella helva]